MEARSVTLTAFGIAGGSALIAFWLLWRGRTRKQKVLGERPVPSLADEMREYEKEKEEVAKDKRMAIVEQFARLKTDKSRKLAIRKLIDQSSIPQAVRDYIAKRRIKGYHDDYERVIGRFADAMTTYEGVPFVYSVLFHDKDLAKSITANDWYYDLPLRLPASFTISHDDVREVVQKLQSYGIPKSKQKAMTELQEIDPYFNVKSFTANADVLFNETLTQSQLRKKLIRMSDDELLMLSQFGDLPHWRIASVKEFLDKYVEGKSLVDKIRNLRRRKGYEEDLTRLLRNLDLRKEQLDYRIAIPLLAKGGGLIALSKRPDVRQFLRERVIRLDDDTRDAVPTMDDINRLARMLVATRPVLADRVLQTLVANNRGWRIVKSLPIKDDAPGNEFLNRLFSRLLPADLSSPEAFERKVSDFLGKKKLEKFDERYGQIEEHAKTRDKLAQRNPEWAIRAFQGEYATGKEIAPIMDEATDFLKKKAEKGNAIFIHGRDGELIHEILRRKGVKSWYGVTSTPLTKEAYKTPKEYDAYLRRICPTTALHVDTGFSGSIPEWMRREKGFDVDEIWLVAADEGHTSRQMPIEFSCLAPKVDESSIEEWVDNYMEGFEHDVDRDEIADNIDRGDYESEEEYEEAIEEAYNDEVERQTDSARDRAYELARDELVSSEPSPAQKIDYIGMVLEDSAQRFRNPRTWVSGEHSFVFAENAPGFWARVYGVADELDLPRQVPPKMVYDPDRKKFVALKGTKLVAG